MQIPKVLVLGATGRIGAILRKCWPMGALKGHVLWQARQYSDETGGANWCLCDLLGDPLGDPGGLARAAMGVDVILCLAGVVPGQDQGQGADLDNNTALAEAAIRAGARAGARVILTSSAAVYGAGSALLDEATTLTPMNAYGRAKVAMEARGAALSAELDVPVCSLRIGNIAGLDAILGGWKPGFRLDRFADGRTPRRSYVGMVTLAGILGDLVLAPALPPVLNVASPGVMEMGALLEAAGLAWDPQTAPQTAIPEVRLSTAALARFTTRTQRTSAAALVKEWRSLKEPAA